MKSISIYVYSYIYNEYFCIQQSQINAHVNATFSPMPENCTLIHGNYSASAESAFASASADGALASADCALFSWGKVPLHDNLGNCSAKPYTGIMCNKQLLAWQECAVGSVQDVVLLDHPLSNGEQSEEERERDVAQFLHFLCKLTPIFSSRRTKFNG